MTIDLIEHLGIKGAQPLRKIATQTTNATAGTRSAHAHGLKDGRGRAVTPTVVVVVPTATDADGVLAEGTIRVVKADSVNVTVRATAVSLAFDLYVG